MNLKKVIASLLSIIIMSTMLIGCYNYKDINRVTFVTSIIFDENEVGNIDIYLDCVKPYRSSNESSDKGRRVLYKGTGKTVLEAMKDINMYSSSKLDFTQCKGYIFTEKAAKNGIRKYIDIINKNQEFMIRPYMFVLFGSPEELLNDVTVDEEYLGVFIDDLVQRMNKSPRVIAIDANDYLELRTNYGNLLVLGALSIRDDMEEKRLELSGGALLKNEVLVRRITAEEGMSYNLLMGDLESGTLEVMNPQDPNTFITLDISNAKTKTSISYDGENIILYKDIKVKCLIGESQSRLIVDEKLLNLLELEEEAVIKQYLELFFESFKESDIDIVNVGNLFYRKYPDEVLEKDPISITNLKLNVDVEIDGTTITGNTL
ncbi:TPA: Ger(x)C family spore germination protein [Clostridium perfringens]|uniref:Ger(x)C family spore germination protein n=1 Tax=Clostridium perfringens TaxID=1502 RepID=UPI000F5300D0|nr:Ger(x)C family spore germination protein [Clostridium perfringens]EHK2279741.1 Ger(x)C family spore germination protein [Clostridium perfringens]ELC8425874.1 Ger(x)C family spore germination protein [Clostridium perfringens]ELQ0173378.1 Ger(x)C family spore germination protein [Clostridium perfringens]MDU7725763.1 Ger(x)C family spore germination protein [Clostridium perfringens]UBK98339.1 Ger(x)C family spore germination protein [Clostridium perfringens]